jgi:putative intracellular protease/amidase
MNIHGKQLAQVLKFFHFNQRPTAIVCHAPILLLTTFPGGWTIGRKPSQADQKDFIYSGYNVTIGSVAEEKILESFFYLKGKKLKFYVAPELRQAGLSVDTIRFPTSEQVVAHKELLTGANPTSTEALGKRFVEK